MGILVVALAAVARGRGPAPSKPPRAAARAEGALAGADGIAVPVDPSGVRDVFRFADEARLGTHREPRPARAEVERPAAPGPTSPRLVGLVRRAGRLMAALSVDGEVDLAGPGDAAAGLTVLSVGEDGVRVRHADGTEETLALP